jgi:hypothetical protein
MSKKHFICLVAARLCVLLLALIALTYPLPAHGDKDETRAAAVRNMTDQELLAEISVNDYSPMVRAAAVRRLDSQFLIAKIAVEDDSKDGIVREAAIERLTDPDLLSRIAAGDESYGKGLSPEVFIRLRTVAEKRIEDQTVLAKVALEDIPADTTKDGTLRMYARILRMTAIGKMSDQALLANVALEGKAGDARKAATQRLTDPPSLAKVMEESKDSDVRDAAKAKLAKTLLRAASVGDVGTVRLLAPSFALDLKDLNGRTLLMLASESGRGDVVKFLLDGGVDVNAENVIQEYVRMPNGSAVYPGPTETALEIASGAPGSVIVPGRRETALSLTSPITHPETRELLINAGAK